MLDFRFRAVADAGRPGCRAGCARRVAARISFSQPVRQAEVEPGRQNRKVPLARPAKARDCSVEVPISSKLSARNISPKPGISLSSSGSKASGVESRPVKPVPPVTRMPSTRFVGDPLRHLRAQQVRCRRAAARGRPARGRPLPARRPGSRRSCPLRRARIRHRQHAQRQRPGMRCRLAHAASVSSFSSSTWCSRVRRSTSSSRSPAMISRQAVQGQPFDAMVGDAALREIVGADALAAIAAADLQAARRRRLRFGLRALLLRASVAFSRFIALSRLACWERSVWFSTTMPLGRWVMRIADSVLLTCWPPAPEERKVSTLQVGRIDLDFLDRLVVGQDRDRRGRGVDAALRLGLRHALHAVRAGFELESRIGAAALDARDDFLVAAVFAGAGGQDFQLPALALGVARVHAEQVAGEDRRLVAAGAGAHFQEDIAFVARILRNQQQAERALPVRRCAPRAAGISSSANSRISGSARMACAAARSRCARVVFAERVARPARAASTRATASRKRALSAITPGSASRRPTSSWRSARASSLRCRPGRHRRSWKMSLGRAQQFGVAVERGLAQRGARRVQQAVGQLVREPLHHVGRVLALRELFLRPAPARWSRARVAVGAQLLQRVLAALRAPPGQVVLAPAGR